ncbi:nitrogen fixation protein FixH [Aquicoccus sp. SCR17]|nr:nitrogen fixation protein FixH [Carideicomes alvinocaridis]
MTHDVSDSGARAPRRFTGWHALAIFGGAFGVIIAVNVALAVNAVRTFPGLEVANSYVASQTFDARRDAQEALGWTVEADADVAAGRVVLHITDRDGAPVIVRSLHGVLGRATEVKDDVEPVFRFDGQAYVAETPIGPGNWNIRMTAVAQDGTEFRQRVVLHVTR